MEILLILLIALIAITILFYNKLVKLSLKVKESNASIDVMYKQRFDTLPNLIQAVKGYMKHEQGVLENVTKMRNILATPGISEEEKHHANQVLSQELPKLLAVAENYPELQASQNFLHLQQTIVHLEENIAAARRTYNAMVNAYNTFIKSFPGVLFASVFGYKESVLIEATAEERQNVRVEF